MVTLLIRAGVVLGLLAAAGCAAGRGEAPVREGKGDSVRVLFVGNSLTYSNDLPAMVRRIGEMDGKRIETEIIARPDVSLEDHLRSRASRRALKSRRADIVVLQQGPSSLEESRSILIRDTQRIRRIVPKQTRVALLTVWPDARRIAAFDRVIDSYWLAAQSVDGIAIPAGNAWKKIVDAGGASLLYSKDGFHPSIAGTWLAALVTYRTLVGDLPPAALTRTGAEKVAPGLNVTDSGMRRLLIGL